MSFSLFSTPQQQPLFQPPQQQQQQHQQGSMFVPQQQQQQPQPQPQPQLQPQMQPPQQQLFLFTTDKAPANYSTKWADLHPDSQKILLQIEYVASCWFITNSKCLLKCEDGKRNLVCEVCLVQL